MSPRRSEGMWVTSARSEAQQRKGNSSVASLNYTLIARIPSLLMSSRALDSKSSLSLSSPPSSTADLNYISKTQVYRSLLKNPSIISNIYGAKSKSPNLSLRVLDVA